MSEEEIIEYIKNNIELTKVIAISYNENDTKRKILDKEIEVYQGLLDLYNKEKNNINKLIRYIAIREDKDFEQVMKEFEIGG